MSMYSRLSDDSVEGFGTVKETTTMSLLMRTSNEGYRRRNKYTRFVKKNWNWLLIAVIATICFTFSNLLIGKASSEGVYVRQFMVLGNFVISVIYMIYWLVHKSKSIKNFLVDYKILDLEYDRYNTHLALRVWLNAVILVAGEYLLILTFQHSLYAEINQGVISSIFILTAVNTAIFTWFLIGVRNKLLPGQYDAYHHFMFREQWNRYDFISFIVILVWIIMLIFNPYSEKNSIVEVFNKEFKLQMPLTTVVLAIITTLYFSIKDMVFKSHIIRYMISPSKLYSMTVFVGGLIMLIPWVINFINYGIAFGAIDSFCGGMLQSIGTYWMIYSLSSENSGFSKNIIGFWFILHSILALIMYEQYLNVIQMIVLILTLICTVLSSVAHFKH